MPLHVMQTKVPRLVDAHRGYGPLQSAQILFSGSCLCIGAQEACVSST